MLTFLCLLMTACSTEFAKLEYNSDEKIARADHCVKSFSFVSERDNELSLSIGKFNGWETIWSGQLREAQDITVEFSFSLSKGQAKIVHIDSDNKVTTVVERSAGHSSDETTEITLPMQRGRNCLKLVGYDCEDIGLKLSFTPSKNEL